MRHQREVHGICNGIKRISPYCCPVSICRRHTKGFSRYWNLQQHLQRMHPSLKREAIVAPLSVPLPRPTKERTKPAIIEVESESLQLDSTVAGGKTTLASLRDCLSRLRTHKAEVDRRIRAVEATIEIFENSGR